MTCTFMTYAIPVVFDLFHGKGRGGGRFVLSAGNNQQDVVRIAHVDTTTLTRVGVHFYIEVHQVEVGDQVRNWCTLWYPMRQFVTLD